MSDQGLWYLSLHKAPFGRWHHIYRLLTQRMIQRFVSSLQIHAQLLCWPEWALEPGIIQPPRSAHGRPLLKKHGLVIHPELQKRCVKWTSINSIDVISSPNPMFDHLLESSRWDDSNKWSNIGFGEEIGIIKIKICNLSGALFIFAC